MPTPRPYALDTKVPIDRTIEQIRTLVRQHGATQWRYGEDEDPGLTWFECVLRDWRLRFAVRHTTRSEVMGSTGYLMRDRQILEAIEREDRRRFRELHLLLKAKLAAVQSGSVDFFEEFLGYVKTEDGETAGARARAYQLHRGDQLTGHAAPLALPLAEVTEEERP